MPQLYRVTVGLKHSLPFNNLSQTFPRSVIYRWCNTSVDYLEAACRTETCRDMLTWLRGYASRSGMEVLYEHSSPGSIDVIVGCSCSGENSTLRMAEEHGCLWVAPVTYLGGEESFELLVFDYEKFLNLFEKYERLGEARIKRKIQAPVNTLRDSFTINLSSIFSSLTERQLRVLEEAMLRGYYEVPRRTSIRDVARALGLSESTTQEHLSKAEAKVVRSIAPYLRMYMRAPKHTNQTERAAGRRGAGEVDQ